MTEPAYITGRSFACVHLEPADYGSDQAVRSWMARGYTVLPGREGHPWGTWCGTCSTDKQEGAS